MAAPTVLDALSWIKDNLDPVSVTLSKEQYAEFKRSLDWRLWHPMRDNPSFCGIQIVQAE